MEWLEADPLPVECQNCEEEECYACDYAGKRWFLPQEEALRIRRKGITRAIERLQRQMDDIDRELFWLELGSYWHNGNLEIFRKLWHENPQYIKEYKENFTREMEDPHSTLRKDHDAWWAHLKERLAVEFGEEWVSEHFID